MRGVKDIQALPAVHMILCNKVMVFPRTVSKKYFNAANHTIERLEKVAEEYNKQFVWDETGQNLIKKQA